MRYRSLALALAIVMAFPMLLGATSASGPLESCVHSVNSRGCTLIQLYDRSLDEPESNFGSSSATAPPAGNPASFNEVGAGFRVPADGDGAILEGLSLLLYRFTGTDLTVTVVGSQPAAGPRIGSSDIEPDSDDVVEQWTTSVTGFRFNLVELQSRSRPILEANEVYWVVISTSQPGTNIGWVAATDSAEPNWWFGERNSTVSDFDWIAFGPRADGYKLRVDATVWQRP